MDGPSPSTADDTVVDESVGVVPWSPRRQRWRWVVLTVGFGILIPVLMVFGASLGRDAQSVRSPLLGKVAPEFDLERLDAPGQLRSSDLNGRIYIVNFWASWCVPCRTETPALDDFYQRWQPRGVEVVGILFSDERDAALEFRREFGGTYPIVNDADAHVAIDFGARGVPETFVIGAVDATTLDDVLAKIGAGSTITEQNDDYRPTTPG